MQGAKVSIYKDIADVQGKEVSLSTVLNAIKNGKWKDKITKLRSIKDEKEQKAYKNTLPCFTGSGVFSSRKNEGLITHSNIMILDFDLKDNPILLEQFNEIRQKLIAAKHIAFLFLSCRGNGFAVGIKIEGARHTESFRYLEKYYREKHGLTIDKGCKDVARLRFISYDPDLYFNEGAETVIVPPDFLKEAKHSEPVFYANGKSHEIVKKIIASGKLPGDDTYESWVRIGFALVTEFGEEGRGYFHELSKLSPKYDLVDCDRKFDNCLKTNKGEVSFATIVHLAKALGIDLVNTAKESKECNETTSFDITKALKIGSELQVMDLPISWAIRGLLPQQAITLLSARGGMGKTILSISMSDAVSRGIPFLGLETTTMQVVYIDFENSLPTLVERVKRINAGNVLFWHPTNEIKPPRLDSKEYELYKKLPEGSLLIFDTLRASQSRDENDSQHMAMIMQRLKELRDAGFTILLLHHTSKSSDRIYKGSTAIFDLCDHNLSLHKVKKGCYTSTPEESDDDDDTDNYCYRLGTQDKTRYEPFHVFLEFDSEKGCFRLAPDPEVETLEEIRNLLVGKEPLKTNDIFELVRNEVGIKSKGKLTHLLRKGIGKYWNSESQGRGRPTYYKATSPAVSLYIPGLPDYPATTSPDKKDQLTHKRLESPDFTDQSSSPAHSRTSRTSQGVTSPDHFEKPRPVQTTSDNTKRVETISAIPIEVPEIEFIEEVQNNV